MLNIMNGLSLRGMQPPVQLSQNVKNCEVSADSVLKFQ